MSGKLSKAETHRALETESGESVGMVFDIKRFAINDGPGIRLTIFMKGCPLSCRWCHNPESISPHIQKMYSAGKCIGCGECVRICPMEACELTPEGVVTETEICNACGLCADICPALASEMSGRYESVSDLLKVIEQERPFFDQSGGGVTFSGGEPLMYPEFLNEMLDACGKLGIHRTVDTSGLASTRTLLKTAKRTDLFLYDLKLMDPVKHKQWTGVGNRRILKNLKLLAESGTDVQIRVPLIKDVNTDEDNIDATAKFVASLSGTHKLVNLLPYHNIAGGKLSKLGICLQPVHLDTPGQADIERITGQFKKRGITAIAGG